MPKYDPSTERSDGTALARVSAPLGLRPCWGNAKKSWKSERM